MIRVQRDAPPYHLTRWAEKWTSDLLEAIERYKNGNSGPPSDSLWNKYNKPYIKSALREMFHDKCAYCESKITHVAYAHIEHYRPKRRYPHLTFRWENLLLACGMCNGPNYKGDRFPLQDDEDNQPLLLNPCEDNPASHIEFKQARVVPLSERGRVTRKLLGLDRDELFDRRRALLRDIDFIRQSVADYESNDNNIMAQRGRELLKKASSAEAEYTAMVRQFLAEPLPERPFF